LALKLDKEIARSRLLSDGRTFLDDPGLRPQIEENWRFIFQEPLVVDEAVSPVGQKRPVGRQKETAPAASAPKRSRKKPADKKRPK
jgi:hypothetical protein